MAKLKCPECPDFDGFAMCSSQLKLHRMNGVISIQKDQKKLMVLLLYLLIYFQGFYERLIQMLIMELYIWNL